MLIPILVAGGLEVHPLTLKMASIPGQPQVVSQKKLKVIFYQKSGERVLQDLNHRQKQVKQVWGMVEYIN